MNTRKLAAVLLIALALSSASFLTSCDSASSGNQEDTAASVTTESKEDETASAPEEETAPAETAAYVCAFEGGKSVALGADAAEAIPALGDYIDVIEAPSCVHEGSDRVYTFDGFTVMTSPDEKGGEYVAEVEIISDACRLESGLSINSPFDDAVAAFGSDYTDQFGICTFTSENAVITVAVLDGAITDIVFKLA